MDFSEVVRRRRMVRRFGSARLDPEVMARILSFGLRGPSAGFAQGVDLLLLDSSEALDQFWSITDPRSRKRPDAQALPPAIVLVLVDKDAYLTRYAQPDKKSLGMDREEAWPVAFWDVDAGMAALLILLAAVDEGLGAWFFGIFRGERELLARLEVPDGRHAIGAIALGYPHPDERPTGSVLSQGRRGVDEAIHRGTWGSG